MSNFKIMFVTLFCTNTLFGQVKISHQVNEVFSYLVKDKRPVFLSPHINSYSFNKIREGLSTNQFIRRITRNDTLHIDTLTISETERVYIDKFLDSLASSIWTNESMKQTGLSYFSLIDTT